MTVIKNVGLVLKDSKGNKGILKSFTDNDIIKIANAITDVGQVVDPATHMPIEATKTSAGVVQLATAQDIKDGTANKVVDAKELNNFAQTLPAVNGVTDVSSGDNSNQIVVSKFGGSKTLTIDNVEHADNADEATHATQADTATSANSVAWDNVSGKSTTLSGYGITDAYTKAQVDKKVSDLVNSAPETLDTLNELANALDNDPNFATTVANQIGTKANDSDVVHTSGDETISGTKTFTSRIVGSIDKAESAKSADSVAWNNVSGKPSTFTPSSHTHDDRYYTESEIDTKLSSKANATDLSSYLPLAGGNITGNLKLKNKNVATEDFVNTSINNLNIIRKNDGNDYYDDSDITSLIYAGNGAGTLRNEIANGNFSRVHPGQTIVGRVTGTTYVVVGCNIYKHRGGTVSNHIGLMPIQLIGNDGNLLWSGRTYAGSGVNNTNQGYAPWASDNDTEGKNQTSCYKDSYIANTVLPKVDNLWLKPDFENQGISVLTFRNLGATSFDANATCMSNPNWRGCANGWGWSSRRLVLPSEPEIYGHYHCSGSPWESGSQHIQLPLYRHKEIHKVYPGVDIWLKDSASALYACNASNSGNANFADTSLVLRVCPVFLIA